MFPSQLHFAHVAIAGALLVATSVEATVGASCTTTQQCTSSGGQCLGGFCCDPALDSKDALACASGTGSPLFASTSTPPDSEESGGVLDTIADNWPYIAGGGAGLMFLVLVTTMYIRRGNRKRLQRREIAAQAPLPTHQRRSHDAKIKPPTSHHHMAASGTLRRKASDLMSIISTNTFTSGRHQGPSLSNHTSASSASTTGGSSIGSGGHRRKVSRFASAHTLIDPEVGLRRNPSSQTMNPSFDEANSPGYGTLGSDHRGRMLSRVGSTLTRKGSALTCASSTLGRAGTRVKRKMGSFESLGSLASSVSGSASDTASYFGKHLQRVQTRMHIGRDRFGSYFGSGDDLTEETSTESTPAASAPPRRPTAPKPQLRRPTAGPPPGLGGSGTNSAQSSRSAAADAVPMPLALMPSSLVQSARHLTPPPPGMGSFSNSNSSLIPPPPPPPLSSPPSFTGDLENYV
jgi:hypothetical protein